VVNYYYVDFKLKVVNHKLQQNAYKLHNCYLTHKISHIKYWIGMEVKQWC